MASVARTITGSHWGVYGTVVRDGRLVATEPFPKDTDPSPLIAAMPGVVYDRTRIAEPMVRRLRVPSWRGWPGAPIPIPVCVKSPVRGRVDPGVVVARSVGGWVRE